MCLGARIMSYSRGRVLCVFRSTVAALLGSFTPLSRRPATCAVKTARVRSGALRAPLCIQADIMAHFAGRREIYHESSFGRPHKHATHAPDYIVFFEKIRQIRNRALWKTTWAIFWKTCKKYGACTKNCQQKGRAKRAPLLMRPFCCTFCIMFDLFLQNVTP